MKKVLALALALIMALSMSAMAFAADETTTTTKASGTLNTCPICKEAEFADEGEFNAHLANCNLKVCPKCDEPFADEDAYNDHIEICTAGDEKDYIDLSVKEILNMIIDLVKASMSQWDSIESVIVRLVDFIENIGSAVVGQADVDGAVADLEASLADVKIPGLSDLLNALKAKIKALYAGEVATTVEVTTEIADPPSTGSSSVGIAVFAAVSVAAAAAYVCTKKSK